MTQSDDPKMHVQRRSLAGFVTGGLAEDERREVSAHIEACAACRAETQALTRLHADMRAALDTEEAPSPRVRREVLARIGAEPKSAVPIATKPARTTWLHTPSMPRWAQAAAIAVIAVQAGLLVTSHRQTAEVTPRGLAAESTRLRIVLNPVASAAQVAEVLGALHAGIVDGPDARGGYVIQLSGADPNAVGEALQRARARHDVLQSIELEPSTMRSNE